MKKILNKYNFLFLANYILLSTPYIILQLSIIPSWETEHATYIQYITWSLKFLIFTLFNFTCYNLLIRLLKNNIQRKLLIILINLFLSFTFISILIYYSYFDFLPHLKSITMISNAAKIGDMILLQLITWKEILILSFFLLNIYISNLLFPKATYNTDKFQLFQNFDIYRLIPFVLFMFPIIYGFIKTIKNKDTKSIEYAITLGSLFYLTIWSILGILGEVRIFLTFAFLLTPFIANYIYDEYKIKEEIK